MTASRPNVLFIITDQHRRDHVGFMGNEFVRTPHLDALAARGMVFENAWVANPVCMPNRSTLMTGRMPSAHGVIFNDRSLEWGANTWVRTMRRAGWRTALIGKSHLQHGMSRNSRREMDLAPVVDDGYPSEWDRLEDFERYEHDLPEWPDDFYGFGHVEIAIDHGARVTGHHLHWALAKGGRYEDLVVPMTADSPALQRSDRWWQVYQPPYGPELHSTTFVTERTIAFIEDSAAAAEPWVCWASFPDPHHPFTPPGEWWGRHDPADMELSPTIDDPLDGAPEYLRRTQQLAPTDQRMWVQPCGATDHDLVREAQAANYATIEMIDDGVGQILASLEQQGQRQNTIVVFTADHGDMMGDHGLMLKGFMPFRGTYQVPFVIDAPGRVPGRSTSLMGSLDVASTMLELAGLPGYVGIQGTSLSPVLDDPRATVRDHVLVEDDYPAHVARGRVPSKIRTLITDDHLKYTRMSEGHGEMLFDLDTDPLELDELASTDAHRRARMIERLTDALIEADDQARGAPVSV